MPQRFWRLAFRLLYNEFAPAYDLVSRAVSLGQWRSWQRTALAHLPEPGPVLEIAHGSGDLQLDLRRAGYASLGLDLSPRMGRVARRKHLRARLPMRLLRADARDIPLGSSSVAAVVCAFPTEFITHERSLAEMARVLQPHGVAVIVLVGMLRGGGFRKSLIRGLYRLTGQSQDPVPDAVIARMFAHEEFELRVELADCRESSVQLVILRRACPRPHPALYSPRQTC